MEVNVHHAKTHLSKLIEQAESGEEVVIARNGKPAVKLVPVADEKPQSLLGSLKGKFILSEDFHQPDSEVESLFNDGPLFPANSASKKKSA